MQTAIVAYNFLIFEVSKFKKSTRFCIVVIFQPFYVISLTKNHIVYIIYKKMIKKFC